MFFFLLWPLFARAPRHWFLENFLLSAPGVQSVFFLLRSVGRRDLSAGPEQKKHHPGCFFFFAPAPGKGRGRRSPVGRRHGARAKKKTPPRVCFFFCCGPGERQGKEKPRWKPARGQSKKKKHHPGVFFLLPPRGKAGEGEPVAKKNTWVVFFFLLWPRAGAQRGFSFPCLSPGPQQKKNTLGGVFFCCGPARTLTHSLRAWVAMPPPRRGGVFFFAAAPPGPGWCFFFAVAPPGRSLTHGGLGRFRQGPGGVFFFLLQPRRVFLDNNKKCLGYYIGSKKTRRGHSKKKNTTSTPMNPET